MAELSAQVVEFLSAGTRTGMLGFVAADGRPLVAPVWFVVDNGELVFNTGRNTAKGRALARDSRIVICVDDPHPPYSFVQVQGTALVTDDAAEMLEIATRIGARYMGAHRADEFGQRRHLRDIQCARLECRGPRSGTARVDSHHDERQDPARRLCRAVRPGPIHPVGRLSRAVGPHPQLPMLVTVLVMAFAVSVEPFRIGMTLLMLNRPRPALQLLAFLSGGFAMGTTVGLVVLFVFRRRLLGSTYFTLPKVQILIGILALLVAVVVALPRRLGSRPAKLATPAQRLLSGHSLSVAGIAGLGIALPSADYLAALAVILASGAAALTQIAVLLMFNVVAFGLVEIPLLAYLLAPKITARSMTALHNWIRSRRRVEVAILLAAVGCVFLAVGTAGL